jgi:branched-chain amino acid transport system permease protein
MNYILHLMIYVCIYGLLALSLNLVLGYTGLFSLSHAVFFAAGAYTYGLMMMNDIHIIWIVIAILAIASLLSLLLSIPSWYLPGDFFMIVTIAVQVILYSLYYNWFSTSKAPGTWDNLTNGPDGLDIAEMRFLDIQVGDLRSMFIVSLIVAAFGFGVVFFSTKSPWGRMLLSIRDNALAASSLGKSLRLTRVQIFAFSSCLAAIAGSLYAAYVRFIDPSIATLDESILIMAMVVVGGTGNFRGPIVGALILISIPEILTFIEIPDQYAANLRLLIYGVALVLIAHWRPQGIAGTYRIE